MKVCPNPECGFANKDTDLLCKECFELLSALTPPIEPLDDDKKVAANVLEPEPSPSPTPTPNPISPQPEPDILGKMKLQIEQGLVVGKNYLIWDNEVTIGRSDEEEGWYPVIDLQDQEELGKFCVSRKHAVLTVRQGKLFIRDLNSARGTRVNQKMLARGEETEVKPGDRIILGGTVALRVVANDLL